MPWSTSRTVCNLYFIVHFIFHIANCLLCILYRVFYCNLGILFIFLHVYLSYFTNPASWLPHWNKRLSCLVSGYCGLCSKLSGGGEWLHEVELNSCKFSAVHGETFQCICTSVNCQTMSHGGQNAWHAHILEIHFWSITLTFRIIRNWSGRWWQ